VFFVLHGTVRVFRTNLDGREQTLIHLGPGAAFNMPAAFADPRAPASAEAMGPVRLLSISRDDFSRLASRNLEIALVVLHDLASKLHHLTDLTYDLSLRSVRGRLAQFLLAHAQDEGAPPLPWTHEQIATQIGTVREVVSRTMRAFARQGLIRKERHRLVVADPDALAREVES
jgi:CRP/FNR family transcriptional regulator